MKYFAVDTYNRRGEFCGWHAIAITDSEQIDDNKADSDRTKPITADAWRGVLGHRRVCSDAAKAELS